MKNLKKIGLIAIALAAAYFGGVETDLFSLQPADGVQNTDDSNRALIAAFEGRQSDVQLRGSGVVARVLRDDNEGSRHQRFIVRISPQQSILVAHNIDLADRVSAIKTGDRVEFFGEYEWNEKGGVIHWTHHDPQGRHVGGWIKHNGQTYQ